MKKIVYFLSIIFCSSCVTSKYRTDIKYPAPFEFKQTDTIVGSKNDLFVKANEWVIKTFVNAKEVIQMHDKEAGKIIAKGIMKSNMTILVTPCTFYVSFILEINVKDNKCRIVLSDFEVIEQQMHSSQGHINSLNDPLNSEEHPKDIYQQAWENIRGDAFNESVDLLKAFDIAMKRKQDNF